MTPKNNLTPEQEKLLTDIHKLALDGDHRLVPFSNDQLKMAKAVIDKAEEKLFRIAELIQVVCGD